MRGEKLTFAFRSGLALPGTFDVSRARIDQLRQWDSVAHLQLVVAIEEAFAIQLTPADVIDLKSYDSAVEILHRHGVWADG